MAAAAALEASDPGRAGRVAAKWQEAMRGRETPTPPTLPPPTLTRPPPTNATQRRQCFGSAVRKPWKLHYAEEELREVEAQEAADPGQYGHEIERMKRWVLAIHADEDSDSTDDDYRPPPERKRKRKEKEREDELIGWESEAPFPEDNEEADFIDPNDILN